MPQRLNKRQQRELEELESLGGSSNAQIQNSSEDETPMSTKPGAASFSNFLSAEDMGEEESEGDEGSVKPKSQKKKKKKKTTATAVAAEVDMSISKPQRNSAPVTPPAAKNERKALKKAKAKEKKAGNDELEEALAELSLKYPGMQRNTSSTPSAQTLVNLLSVSLAHLDPEAEMRKFFGSKVVEANRSTPSSSGSPGSRRQTNAPAQRSHLTRPQPTWWNTNKREGLTLRSLTEEEVREKEARSEWSVEGDGVKERWWTVEYSKRYKSVTKAFMQAVMAGDPEAFWDLLSKLPWHADTLLQLSEVYRHREEYGDAVDFVDRALFTYERSFLGNFTFTSGTNRLDFDHVENRPFFLAVHRQVADYQRRGCVRTAFEFARLLYALDPWTDPHGALLHLDLLALKAGMGPWLLKLYDWFVSQRHRREKVDGRMDPSVLPGWAYARALALRMEEDVRKNVEHQESTKALEEAIAGFPSVVPLLADKLDLSIAASIRGHRNFRIETDANSLSASDATLHLLSHLYVQHSSSLWKDPIYSSWFINTLTSLFPSPSLPSSLPQSLQRTAFLALFRHAKLQASVHRHIFVLESTYRRLFAFIPRTNLETFAASGALACDPLPPATAVSKYDDAFFHGIEDVWGGGGRRSRTRRERALDERRLAQMIPDAEFRRQLQAFFAANPGLANQFPGGILQFAQMAGQEGVLEDMMAIQLADGGAGVMPRQAGEMPGQMPGFEFLAEEVPGEFVMRDIQEEVHHELGVDDENEEGNGDTEEEEDDDDEAYTSTMPRVLRNFIGRLWGRAPAEDSSDEEDEKEPEPVDDTDID